MQIHVLLLEDNPITASDLKEMLSEHNMEVCRIYFSAEDALNNFDKEKPDIMLVDILLKGKMTGIDFVKRVRQYSNIPVVYLTSNMDRGTIKEALDTKPITYLTKPYKEVDVQVALELAFQSLQDVSIGKESEVPDFIFLKQGGKYQKVPYNEILYIEADGSYCKVFTPYCQYVLSSNMNHFEAAFAKAGMLRIHRSYIVNVNAIEEMDNDYVFIASQSIPIGRSYRLIVKNRLPKLS